MSWPLPAALHRATLLDASPAYGLNALGGTLVLETATGRSDPGLAAAASLGSYGERQTSLSGGGATGAFSYFGAFQYRREHGWRDYSPSELTNGYADLGFDEDWGGVHAKFIAADTVKNFLCTIKFQGETDFATQARFAAIPGSRLIHLHVNKHELTWVRLNPS